MSLVVLAVILGIVDPVEIDQLRDSVRGAGWAGPLVFILLMTGFVAVGVPGIVFILSASALWPTPGAVGVVLAGGLAASSLRFLFARSVGRRWVEARLPAKLRRWDARLEDGGVGVVIALRLLFNLSAPPDWLLGLSRIGPSRYLLGTVIGRVPPTVILVVSGDEIIRSLTRASLAAFGVALVVTATYTVRRRKGALRG